MCMHLHVRLGAEREKQDNSNMKICDSNRSPHFRVAVLVEQNSSQVAL